MNIKKNIKIYFFFLIGLIVVSCGNSLDVSTYHVVKVDSVEERSAQLFELKGENFGPEGDFGYLIDVLLCKSEIIVQDKMKDFAFFKLNDDVGLEPFQAIGYGPNEVKRSELLKVVNCDEESGEIYFFNYSTKSLYSVGSKPGAQLINFSRIPGDYWKSIQSSVNLNDSLVAVTGLFTQTKFAVFNRNTQKEVFRSEYLNSFPNDLNEEGRIATAPTDMKYNRKHDLIVLNKSSVNSIDTYSVDGKVNKLYSFGEMDNISTEDVFSNDFFYYYSVKTKDDLVYGLYLGLGQNIMVMQDVFFSSSRPELHVFNLVTDELLRLKLDRLVNVCVLDVDNNFVYCIDENNENQPLVKYEIPKEI